MTAAARVRFHDMVRDHGFEYAIAQIAVELDAIQQRVEALELADSALQFNEKNKKD